MARSCCARCVGLAGACSAPPVLVTSLEGCARAAEVPKNWVMATAAMLPCTLGFGLALPVPGAGCWLLVGVPGGFAEADVAGCFGFCVMKPFILPCIADSSPGLRPSVLFLLLRLESSVRLKQASESIRN